MEEDLFESHSWTTGVALPTKVGVGLLCCVCAVFNPDLPTGSVQVTREPEVARQPSGMTLRSMRNEIINHVREKMWSLSWYSGDQLWQLMEMLNAQYCRNALVHLLRRIAIMSENQTRCSGDDRVQSEFFDGVTGGDDYLYESKLWDHDHILTHALDDEWTRDDGNVRRVLVKLSDAHDWNTELNQQSCTRVAHAGRETRGMEHSRMRWVTIQPSSIGTVTRPRVTMVKAQCGLMVVTQWKGCRENDETASVCQVRCRVANEASLKRVVA